jgi:hypothetical protein
MQKVAYEMHGSTRGTLTGSDSSNDMMPERACRHHIIFQRNAPNKSGALYGDQTIFLSAFLNE